MHKSLLVIYSLSECLERQSVILSKRITTLKQREKVLTKKQISKFMAKIIAEVIYISAITTQIVKEMNFLKQFLES